MDTTSRRKNLIKMMERSRSLKQTVKLYVEESMKAKKLG